MNTEIRSFSDLIEDYIEGRKGTKELILNYGATIEMVCQQILIYEKKSDEKRIEKMVEILGEMALDLASGNLGEIEYLLGLNGIDRDGDIKSPKLKIVAEKAARKVEITENNYSEAEDLMDKYEDFAVFYGIIREKIDAF